MSEASEFRADLCWQDRAGEAWVRFERHIDIQLEPFGRAALQRLAPKAGESALEIGCGSGQTLLELGRLVGPNGSVLGVDISEPMALRARERLAEAKLANVKVELGDAQTHAFNADFDLVFSRFGVMFFQDSVAAFRNLRSALRAGGRLGFACWQGLEKNQWAELLLSTVRAVAPSRPLPPLYESDRPGPFLFRDAAKVGSILESAGFSSIAVESMEGPMNFGGARTLVEAVEYAVGLGPAARFIADAGAELLPEFRTALERALLPYVSVRGVYLESAAFIVTARAG